MNRLNRPHLIFVGGDSHETTSSSASHVLAPTHTASSEAKRSSDSYGDEDDEPPEDRPIIKLPRR